MKKVAVLLADGFEEIEALTVVDILRRASVYVDTVSITDEYKVRGSHGINVQTEDLFDEVNFVEFDMIVLPGGMPGTTNLDEHPGVKRVVEDYVTSGKYVAANSLLILVDGENSGEVFRTPIDGYQGSTFKLLSINCQAQ